MRYADVDKPRRWPRPPGCGYRWLRLWREIVTSSSDLLCAEFSKFPPKKSTYLSRAEVGIVGRPSSLHTLRTISDSLSILVSRPFSPSVVLLELFRVAKQASALYLSEDWKFVSEE